MARYGLNRRINRWLMFLPLTIFWLGTALSAPATPADLPAVVATVQGQPIAAEDLAASLQGELFRLQQQRYEVFKTGLDALITARLMDLEATKQKVSVEQLRQEEIVAKIAPVTSEQIKAFYEKRKNRIKQSLEQITPRIKAYLRRQAQEKREAVFLAELRQRYTVTIALQAPRVDVSSDDDPALGPEDAPVTIVEFSDFQCPFCRRVQPTLKRLLQEYEGRVKLVFRDFPLRSIHPQAQKAAEAAQCAAEQRQFWPYHDQLFASSALRPDDLKRYAQEMGLNTEQFNACLDSDKYATEVEADLQDGVDVGVSATPAFFINGQPLSGAVPYERFKELIEASLAQRQSVQRATP
ncbi:MAG: thioredoxin domain-containing protein [Candidatus Tectomicrobia bacterium]